MILGVTGGIASGKSTVSEMFRKLGAEVVSADALAREAVRPGSEGLKRLVERFGSGILMEDGTLDRQGLGNLIFADPGARQDLNRILHPIVAALSEERLRQMERSGLPLVVYESPLLFEAGAENRVDAVLVVLVREDLQIERLMAREGISEVEARARIASQMSQEEKAGRADYVLDNSGHREETEAQVRALFSRLAEGCSSPGTRGN